MGFTPSFMGHRWNRYIDVDPDTNVCGFYGDLTKILLHIHHEPVHNIIKSNRAQRRP